MRIFFKEAKGEEVSIARINKNGQALEIVQHVIRLHALVLLEADGAHALLELLALKLESQPCGTQSSCWGST
jgi:hypothetical protein